MLILILILILIISLIIIQKKKEKIFNFVKNNQILCSVIFSLFCLINLCLFLKINSVNVLADQKFVEKVKRERIIFIRNYVKQQSKYFNNFDHDFSLTKTNALNVLLDYQINQMNDFDLQYVQMTGIRDFARRFDTNIDVLLSDTGEFGQALQQCSLIIEDVFKEMSNTPGLARRKLKDIEQMRFQEGEVIFRKLPDEVFDNYAKFITDEKMNEEIFEACSVIVRKFFCIKYSKKKFAGDQYAFEHDPVFRKQIAEVARKYLSEHQEFK